MKSLVAGHSWSSRLMQSAEDLHDVRSDVWGNAVADMTSGLARQAKLLDSRTGRVENRSGDH